MKPSQEPTNGERVILRWFLLLLAVITGIYLLATWWQKSSDCREQCTSQGRGEGTLRFNGGGRFNMGNFCECAGSTRQAFGSGRRLGVCTSASEGIDNLSGNKESAQLPPFLFPDNKSDVCKVWGWSWTLTPMPLQEVDRPSICPSHLVESIRSFADIPCQHAALC